jgi:hypothetical protein
MRLHAYTELAKRKGCELCVWYSEHFSGLLFKIHIKSYPGYDYEAQTAAGHAAGMAVGTS